MSEKIKEGLVDKVDDIVNLLEESLQHPLVKPQMETVVAHTAPVVEVPKSLREAGLQYITLLLIAVANIGFNGDWELILSLALAYAVFLFSGWVKKIAEIEIGKILAQSRLKDEEIMDLRTIKAKLQAEISRLSEKCSELAKRV